MPMPKVRAARGCRETPGRPAPCAQEWASLCAPAWLRPCVTSPLRAQPTPAAEISFDIPAQPIASALEAYSSATGIELFYDGALAGRPIVQAVIGRLTPDAALLALLAGTGLVARVAGRTSLSLVQSVPSRGPSTAGSILLERRPEAPRTGAVRACRDPAGRLRSVAAHLDNGIGDRHTRATRRPRRQLHPVTDAAALRG